MNKRYNRFESETEHYYHNNFGVHKLGKQQYNGFIKCKLLHGKYDDTTLVSVIAPDVIILGNKREFKWIQPFGFLPCFLAFFDDDIRCQILVDISLGYVIQVVFNNSDFVRKLPDGSELYRCKITGPASLYSFATGTGKFDAEYSPFLKLFHHTTEQWEPVILNSKKLKSSAINIQGFKELKNVGYGYLTSLEEVKTESDLEQMAMSSRGKTKLMTDFPHMIKDVELYVKTLDSFTRRVDFLVEAAALSSQHLLKHYGEMTAYYEVCRPFIHRVGTEPGGFIDFDSQHRIKFTETTRIFDYVVVGDMRTPEGLFAPFNEQDTEYMMKVEVVPRESNILQFWRDNGNQDHYHNKKIQMMEFGQTINKP